ncbi:MAG: multicopper oxidase family protein [Bacteroidales bacterium]|nr:multicopper oxidase family protein [Bacteroidales bacterium]
MKKERPIKDLSISPIILLIFAFLFVQCNTDGQQNSSDINKNISDDFEADIDIELTAAEDNVQLLPGAKTEVYTYQAKLIKGDNSDLEKLNDTYLGPIIHVKQGQKIRVRFKNQLPRESIIHWHGMHIPAEMDGHPKYAIDQGEEYIYEFQVNNRPGTYWFHPHPHQITGPQVYYGLAGMFLVEEDNAKLPSGEFDRPLILQDRTFNANNQLVYLEDNRMARMEGFLGNRMFVNGKVERQMEVKKTAYRFRVLNGSNSRIYKLAWSDGSDITAIGTGGGLLEEPAERPYIMLAPGERIDIWKDFSKNQTNDNVVLKSLPFNPGTNIGMGGMMGNRRQSGRKIENGADMELFTFTVNDKQGPQKQLPGSFSKIEKINPKDAVNAKDPKRFNFTFQRMEWVINGETFEMNEVADWETVKLNTTEIWEFINGGESGGMGRMGNMMQMPHPVHIHGLQFQILGRDMSGVDRAVWRTVKDGFVDEGWQDTFLLLPGMKTQVIMRFRDFTGKYIYHCHNLEHEDMGMMRNYEVIK